jgi:transposase
MITMNLFKTIKNYKKQGYGIRKISRKLHISRKTVSKYYKMSDQEFVNYRINANKKERVFHQYKDEIIEIFKINEEKVYTSSIYDLLEEKYGKENLPGTERTLRNYISWLSVSENIHKGIETRIYKPVDELPFGKQLQVDFGQLMISTGERVYIFASVLSASRFRYVSVQNRPFTTLDVILHLLDCFEYIGGIPEQIAIDQDRTLVVDENVGDIILTKSFQQFKDEMGFDLYVCRKADPESKGKVENLVKFVKTSFFSARTFKDFPEVQERLSSWLVRTANGKISQATGAIPANLLEKERERLKPLRASVFKRDTILEREPRKVDGKSYISVGSSKYSAPIHFRNKEVWIYRTDKDLFIYDALAGKQIAKHKLSPIPGQKVIINQHFWDASVKQTCLRDELIKKVSVPGWSEFVNKNYRRYTRYFREQHRQIERFLAKGFDDQLLMDALELCDEMDGYTANNLEEAYSYFQGVTNESHNNILPALMTGIKAVKENSKNPKVVKRQLSYYTSLINIVGGVL